MIRSLCLGALLLVGFVHASLSVAPIEPVSTFSTNEVIVVLKKQLPSLTTFSSDDPLRTFSSVNIKNNIGTVAVEQGATVAQTIASLENNPLVDYVQPNYVYHTLSFPTPSDTFFGYQWGLDNQGQALSNSGNTTGVVGADIGWLSGMALFSGIDNPATTGTVVAVIDNGVLYSHEDLQGRMWDGISCVDENGNALGNCLYGYDFYDDDLNPAPSGTDWHGTHVAGIVGASLNSSGVVGVNPNVRIMALRAGIGTSLTTLSVVNSIRFAQYNGAKIINASFGGSGSDTLLRDTIGSYSGLFITAAGNQGLSHTSTSIYPCDYTFSNVICVGAFTQKDAYASFSDYSTTSVDVAAPGEYVASTFNSGGSAYAYSNGTSMATPFVVGIASILWNYYPNATRDQIRQAILSGVVVQPYLSGKVATSGRVNLYNSLIQLQDIMLTASLTPSAFTFDTITGAFPNVLLTSNIVTLTGFSTGLDVWVTNGLYSINGGSWSGAGTTGVAYSGDTLQLAFTSTQSLSTLDRMTVNVGNYYTDFNIITTDPLPGPTGTITYPSGYYYNHTGFTIQIASASGVKYTISGTGFSGYAFSGTLLSGTNNIPVFLSGTTGKNYITIELGTSPYITSYTGVSVNYDVSVPYFVAYVTSGMTITGTSLTFTGSVYDDQALGALTISGVVNTSCDFSGSNLTGCSFTHSIVFPGSGINYIPFNLVDKAGNAFPANTPIPIIVDLTDRTPDTFTFSSVSSAARSTVYTSSIASIIGVDTGVAVSVSAGEYRINGGSRGSSAGIISSGDTLEIRLTSSSSYSSAVSTTVTVGYYITTFTITTQSAPVTGGGPTGGGPSCSLSSVPHGTVNSSLCVIVCSAGYTLNGGQCILSTTGSVSTGGNIPLFSDDEDQKTITKKINEHTVSFRVPLTTNTKFNNLINALLSWVVSDATKNNLSTSRLNLIRDRFDRFADALYAYLTSDNVAARFQLVGDFKSLQDLLKPEDGTTEFTNALAFLYANGMTSYNTESAFRPNDTITREQAAKMYALFMKNVRGVESVIDESCVFTDLDTADQTLLPSIRQSCWYGLMQGSDKKFRPKGTLTRAEAVTLTVRSLGLTAASTNPWYKGYIDIAAAQNIVGSSSLDGANSTITRRDVAIMLYRAGNK